MRSSIIPFTILCSLLYPALAQASAFVRNDVRNFESPVVRHLSPAAIPMKLTERSTLGNLLKREVTFDFIDANGPENSDTTFVTRLTVQGDQQILALEDLELDILDITCSESTIELTFSSTEKLELAATELEEAAPFVVVTSHLDCNEDDERAPHLVTDVTVDKDREMIVLSKRSCEWKDAFTSVDVSFSRESSSSALRKRYQNQKRQDETPTPIDRDFPSATGEPSGLPSDSHTELSMKLEDQVILPPQFPGSELIANYTPIPEGVTLKCKNCSLEGILDLSQGGVKLGDGDNFFEDLDDTVDFFQDGTLELDVDGLFAHIELELEFDANIGLFNHTIPLPTIPMTPFNIPGIVQFGIIFNPQILVTLELEQEMKFSYGFNLTVPDNSGFTIDVGELSNSSVTGFDQTEFNTLPFQSSIEAKSLVFTISFSPEILLGVRSPIGDSFGGIGAFFNIPHITVNATQLDEVDEDCNFLPESEKNEESDDSESTFDKLIGNYTNINPSIELSMGPLAQLEINVGSFEKSLATQVTIASTVFPLPTACLAFDDEDSTFKRPADLAKEEEEETASKPAVDTADSEGGSNKAADGAAGRVDLSIWMCTMLASVALLLGIAL